MKTRKPLAFVKELRCFVNWSSIRLVAEVAQIDFPVLSSPPTPTLRRDQIDLRLSSDPR